VDDMVSVVDGVLSVGWRRTAERRSRSDNAGWDTPRAALTSIVELGVAMEPINAEGRGLADKEANVLSFC